MGAETILDVNAPIDTAKKKQSQTMYYPRENFQANVDSSFERLFWFLENQNRILEAQSRLLELLTNEIISLNRSQRRKQIKKLFFKKSK